MTQTDWHKLDRDRTVAMIESVKSAGDHILFSLATSEAKCARLSFYRNLLLYRLTNYASLPSFSFNYIGDGITFLHLDGTMSAIETANQSGNLILDQTTVIDYIRFFFDNVTGPDGDVYVIDNPHDHPALEALDVDQLDNIMIHHEPPEIADDGMGGFVVRVSLFYLGILVRGTITVDAAGAVEVTDTHMLLSTSSTLSAQGAMP